jgi:type VI secretion system secreted protein VgrG
VSNVSRLIAGFQAFNALNLKLVRIYFQRYPGTAGTPAERGIAGVPYEIEIGGATTSGTTAPDGHVDVLLPAGATAMLRIFNSEYTVSVKDILEGLNTVHGQQRRLSMLGYELGAIDGTVGRRTDDATLSFQADNNLDTDGIVGAKTTNKLRTQVGE